MDKLNWGIIGPGIIAQEFAHDFQFSSHGKLVAVASRSESRAREFASKFGIPIYYDDYNKLYNDPSVDVIYVATPHNFHKEQSAAALQAGKAILCEKPLTENLDRSKGLISLAKLSGNYLMEGMWTWFLPAIRKALEWFEEGRIGEIKHIKADFGYPSQYDPASRLYNPDLAGGCLLDMGIYTIAITHLFIPEDPLKMNVVARKAPTGVDIDVSMQFIYPDAVANLTSAFRIKLHNWAYIIGEKGYIAIPDFWRTKDCFLYEGDHVVDHFNDEHEGFGFNFEIDAVSQDIMKGKKESDVVSHTSSLRLAKAMNEVIRLF